MMVVFSVIKSKQTSVNKNLSHFLIDKSCNPVSPVVYHQWYMPAQMCFKECYVFFQNLKEIYFLNFSQAG